MLKKILLILIIVFAILTIITCKPVQKTNEVVFWTLQLGTFGGYMNPLIAEFEKENPEIKIKWIDVPYSEGEKRTLASILSNTPPDLVNLTPEFSSVLAQKEALHYIDCNDLNIYNEQILNTFKKDSKCYAVPFYATSALTFYNKAIFKKAGISQVPKDYESLFRLSNQVKEKTGKFLTMPTLTENDTMLKILNKYSINSPQTLASERSIEIFDGFKELYENNLIPKESITQTHREALEKYMSGEIALIQSGPNFLMMVKDNAPDVYKVTDTAPQLIGDTKKFDVSVMNLIIPARARNKEAALKFAIFLTNSKNQLELAKLTSVLPVNNETLKDNYFKQYDKNDTISKARALSADQLNNLSEPMKNSRNHKEIITLLNSSVQEIMLDKNSTESILNKTSQLWNDLIK